MNNCKPGSAWHSWQSQGRKWADMVGEFTPESLHRAAWKFSWLGDYPEHGRHARYRAFTEGAIA